MINFHSPLLKSMPQATDRKRIALIIKRIIITLPVATIILVPIWLTASRILDKTGWERWGHFLYHIHDKYYLWAKGYLYTLCFPNSLIWWGLISTVFISWLISFLLVKSKTRAWHIRLLRTALKHTYLHQYLISAAYWLKRFRLGQQLLYEVVSHGKTSALNQLMASPPGQADLPKCAAVADLTILYIRLLLIHQPAIGDHLNAAVCFHEAFIQIRRFGDLNAKWFPNIMARLTGILDKVLDYKDLSQQQETLKDVNIKNADPSLQYFAKDLYYLVSMTVNRKIARKVLNSDVTAKPEKVFRQMVSGMLAESVDIRRTELDKIRSRLETAVFRNHRKPDIAESFPLLSGQKENLQLKGKLVLRIALDLAALSNMPEIALTYIDTFEALSLVSEMTEQRLGSKAAYIADRVSHFIGELPTPDDYRLCAELGKAKLAECENKWKQSPLSKESVLTSHDFDLARARISALYHAAGPDFDISDQETE